MAKIKFSALVSDVRNSLNGSTFARNRGGSYFRNKTTPVNPQTAYQSAVRAGFGGISQAWRALSEEQRSTWNEESANFPYTDVFGDTRTLSGFQLHQKLNNNLIQIAQPLIQVAPAKQEMTAITAMAAVLSSLTKSLTVTFEATPVNQDLIIQATAGVSAGRSFLKNDFRTIGFEENPDTGTTINIGSRYTAKFGDVVPGQKIGIRIWLVHRSTGQVSPMFSGNFIAS